MSVENEADLHKSQINKILIADDSKTEREHLKQLLLSSGYEVISADSGKAAIELISTDSPDLILLDIIMDNGDGYQTCRSLKKNPDTKNIPVIMVSSKSNDVDKKWAMKLGAVDYITKPYSEDELLQRINGL